MDSVTKEWFYMKSPLLKEIINFLPPLDVSSSLHVAEMSFSEAAACLVGSGLYVSDS